MLVLEYRKVLCGVALRHPFQSQTPSFYKQRNPTAETWLHVSSSSEQRARCKTSWGKTAKYIPSSSLFSSGTLHAIRFLAVRPSSATIFLTLSWLLERWKEAWKHEMQEWKIRIYIYMCVYSFDMLILSNMWLNPSGFTDNIFLPAVRNRYVFSQSTWQAKWLASMTQEFLPSPQNRYAYTTLTLTFI